MDMSGGEVTIGAEGGEALDRVLAMLEATDTDGVAEVELRIAYEQEASHDQERPSSDSRRPRPSRVKAGTNQHRALWLVYEYLKREDAETVTQGELADHPVSDRTDLTPKQVGNALNSLHRKDLLTVEDKTNGPPPTMNIYRLPEAGRDELERVGPPEEFVSDE